MPNTPIFLDQDLILALNWQQAGKLSWARTPFGQIIRDEFLDYWIAGKDSLMKLSYQEESRQFLAEQPDNQSLVGLVSLAPFANRLIVWVAAEDIEPSTDTNTRISDINERQSHLTQQFDDGDITVNEFMAGLESLNSARIEVAVRSTRKLSWHLKAPRFTRRVLAMSFVVFVIGLFMGPIMHEKTFGFSSAEECVLAKGGSRGTVGACYELYPSISEIRANAK